VRAAARYASCLRMFYALGTQPSLPRRPYNGHGHRAATTQAAARHGAMRAAHLPRDQRARASGGPRSARRAGALDAGALPQAVRSWYGR
jgi:hypothetical protein